MFVEQISSVTFYDQNLSKAGTSHRLHTEVEDRSTVKMLVAVVVHCPTVVGLCLQMDQIQRLKQKGAVPEQKPVRPAG